MKRNLCYFTQKSFLVVVGGIAIIESAPGPDLWDLRWRWYWDDLYMTWTWPEHDLDMTWTWSGPELDNLCVIGNCLVCCLVYRAKVTRLDNCPQGGRARFGFNELNQEVWHYQGPLWEPPPMCGQIPEFWFFEKNHFSHFLELKKAIFKGFLGLSWTFFTPIPSLASKLMVLGFILLIILDLSFGFWSNFLAKQATKIFSNQ